VRGALTVGVLRTAACALAVTALVAAVLPLAPAAAIVPPTDCKFIRVNGKRYNVKADQLRCRDAVSMARAYLARHRKPRGYACRDFRGGTQLRFRCSRGTKVFFAIRR
jgi:hypothetical protein